MITGTNGASSGQYDRHVYMGDDGRLNFGVYSGSRYVLTSPAAYNDGRLTGKWIDLDGKSGSDIEAQIETLLERWSDEAGELREEYAVHDWEGQGLKDFGESPDWDEVAAYIEAVEEHGEAFRAWVDWMDGDAGEIERFTDEYHGTCESEAVYAHDLVTECYGFDDLPSILSCHIDWQGVARDLSCDGYTFVHGSEGVHVFCSC